MTDAHTNAAPAERHVTFDLAKGQVKRDRSGGDERLVLVPPAALDDLGRAAGQEVARRFARTIGGGIGRRVAENLGSVDGALGASLEALVSELALEVAISGWGSLSVERWGRAMIVAIEYSPVEDPQLIEVLVEGAIEAAAGRAVRGVSLGGAATRILVASETTAERVRGWMAEGATGQDVIARLHTPGPAGSQA